MTIKSPRNSELFNENLIRPNAVLAGISTAHTLDFLVSRLALTIVVGCSLTFSCTPKDVKVHADDNGTIVLLTF